MGFGAELAVLNKLSGFKKRMANIKGKQFLWISYLILLTMFFFSNQRERGTEALGVVTY